MRNSERLLVQFVSATIVFMAGEVNAAEVAYAAPSTPKHAFVIGIGEYAYSPESSLKGVTTDRRSATKIANMLGVPSSQVSVLADKNATRPAVLEGLKNLVRDVPEGGQAFVYFSGHGTRFKESNGVCREGLLLTDGSLLTKDELNKVLAPLVAKADAVTVAIDACFSEGTGQGMMMASRSINSSLVKPKFRSKEGASLDECAAVNTKVKARGVANEKALRWAEGPAIEITTARRNEIAWDSPTGGVGTNALLACMEQASGVISAGGLQSCAQQNMDSFAQSSGVIPSHIMVTASARSILPVMVKPTKPLEPSTPAAVVSPTVLNTATAPLTQVPTAQTEALPISVSEAFDTVANGAKQRLAATASTTVKVGETYQIEVKPPFDGYTYVMAVGTDGNSYLLYPNEASGIAPIQKKDKTLKLPGAQPWKLVAAGPSGSNHFLILHTRSPRSLEKLIDREILSPTIGEAVTVKSFDSITPKGLLDWVYASGTEGVRDLRYAAKVFKVQEQD